VASGRGPRGRGGSKRRLDLSNRKTLGEERGLLLPVVGGKKTQDLRGGEKNSILPFRNRPWGLDHTAERGGGGEIPEENGGHRPSQCARWGRKKTTRRYQEGGEAWAFRVLGRVEGTNGESLAQEDRGRLRQT